jgi:ArsR family transcriptional regulator
MFVAIKHDTYYIHKIEYVDYHTFRFMHMKKQSIPQIAEQIAVPLEIIASPQRIALLLAIGQGEACVCHLETALGWRQAYISQHLMALRKANILEDRREGRYVFYRLKATSYLDLIMASGEVCRLSKEVVFGLINTQRYPSCECPHCAPNVISVDTLTIKASS